MPVKNIESLQPALQELERAIRWAADTIDDIPFKLVPVIQSHGKRARCMGWFSADQWSTREGEPVCEITFAAEVLDSDPVKIVAAAVHEVVHFWCHFLDLKDTSKSGRHNKLFKEYAEIVGLECEQPYDAYGFGYTSPSESLRERIEKEFQPDVAAFNLFRIVKPRTTAVVKTNAWICECDKLTLRIPAKQVLDATCHKCGIKFVPKEPDGEAPVKDGLAVIAVVDLADAINRVGVEAFEAHLKLPDNNHDHPDEYPLHQHGGKSHGNYTVDDDGGYDHDADTEYAGVAEGEEAEETAPQRKSGVVTKAKKTKKNKAS